MAENDRVHASSPPPPPARTLLTLLIALLLAGIFTTVQAVPPRRMPPAARNTFPRPVPPSWVQSWAPANSTAIYACNYSGFFDAKFLAQFALVQLDWSTGKNVWANQHPMDAETLMIDQVERIQRARPGTITMVYRNTVKALSWFRSVREKLVDPAYAGFFLSYATSATNPSSPACDTAYSPPLCSRLYHDQMQTPQYKVHDDGQNGTCFAPCDCGGVPVGEYLFDLRNNSAREFLLEHVLSSTALGHPSVTGLYLDDYWVNHQEPIYPDGNQPPWGYCSHTPTGGPSEIQLDCIKDMGLTQQDVDDLYAGWRMSYDTIIDAMGDAGAIAYQSFHFLSTPSAAHIYSDLLSNCQQGEHSPLYTAPLMHILTTPPACCPATRNTTLLQFEQDLAYFMLVRGPWAWIGYNYEFCAERYTMPRALADDYGAALGTCAPTHPGSTVFAREYERATVFFDTSDYTGTIVKKQ
jgi:hypothetical protein